MGPMILKWLKLSLVALVGCGFVAMVIYAFVQRDQIRSAQIEPPLVSAPEEAVKRRPEAPGGMEIPNRDKLVFDLLENDTGVRAVTPDVPLAPLAAASGSVAAVAAPVSASQVVSAAVALAEIEPAAVQPLPVVAEKPIEKPAEKVVEKKVTEKPAEKAKGGWGVQLGAVSGKANAEAAAAKLGKQPALKGMRALVVAAPDGKHYRIQFAGAANRAAAQKVCAGLGAKQPCFPVMMK